VIEHTKSEAEGCRLLGEEHGADKVVGGAINYSKCLSRAEGGRGREGDGDGKQGEGREKGVLAGGGGRGWRGKGRGREKGTRGGGRGHKKGSKETGTFLGRVEFARGMTKMCS
jgi:hypothetical protein